MFTADYWPTPPEVAGRMISFINPQGLTILEPSAGSGNIVLELKKMGAKVIACESDIRLKRILEHECDVISNDFFDVTSDMISHIHAIIMNPPFRNAEKHIQHAWNICPPGCEIVALCNETMINNPHSRYRAEINNVIDNYGYSQSWGKCFSTAERETEVLVSVVYLKKPGVNDNPYSDFFMEEEPDEAGEYGILEYDVIRDMVSRYVGAVKLYEEQIVVGVKMREFIKIFPQYNNNKGSEDRMKYISCNPEKVEEYKIYFKKGLQKRAWKYIFDKLDMAKHSTKGLKEDINKFVEQQVNVPFTMKNIYHMLHIVVGTTGSRMDKALMEVFEQLTKHYDENRYGVEGWKTNSHYLLNQKFILNNVVQVGWSQQIDFNYYRNGEMIEDFAKALCYMTGSRYEDMNTLRETILGKKYINGSYKESDLPEGKPDWGQWFTWGFFEVRAYKKGTMHFKFKDIKVWEEYNYNVARISGFPLHEFKEQVKKHK